MRFIDIARGIYVHAQENSLPVPRITLAFGAVVDARRAWHKVLDEFPEWSLDPTNQPSVENGEVGIHGVAFRFVPFK